jgi:hypothetical protein
MLNVYCTAFPRRINSVKKPGVSVPPVYTHRSTLRSEVSKAQRSYFYYLL